jgi:hypothetical protein
MANAGDPGRIAATVAAAFLCAAALGPAACLAARPATGPATAPAAAARVPLIYSTDLYHPHIDLDDHFDLANVLALPELDVKAVILDIDGKLARSGQPAIEQMQALTGRTIPVAVGLKSKLKSPDDKALDQPAEFQHGVQLILDVLRDAKAPVTIVTTGSMRDVMAALHREPDLCRAKIGVIYANVGNAVAGGAEYNIDLDPAAYRAMFDSGLPIYWFPCYPLEHKGATFWRFDYTSMFQPGGGVAEGLQNYFLYAMRGVNPQQVPPLEAFRPDFRQRIGLTAMPKGNKEMWCTPSIFAAAGRRIYRVGPDRWVAAATPPAGGKEEAVFRFVPARVELGPDGKATKVEYDSARPNVKAFLRDDPALYGRAMNTCLMELYRDFPTARK